jgi:hypothetical protein
MSAREKAIEYVMKHATRGACQCGKCIVSNGTEQAPEGKTINLTFFEVGQCGGNREEFEALFREAFPEWFDGEEHNYINEGAEVGDQGLCMMAFGLGHLLGVWKCLCPETMMPFLPEALKQQMAGSGMVAIQAA